MIIKGKCYCDVCFERISNTSETRFMFAGVQERHYCKDHRVWYDLWNDLLNDEEVGKLTFPHVNKSTDEKKEVTVLEAYDVIMNLFADHYGHLVDIAVTDKDIQDYYKTDLATNISYNRLKIRGEVKDDN